MRNTLGSWTAFTFKFLGVPARLIIHEIKISRFVRAGKATAMENGQVMPEIQSPNFDQKCKNLVTGVGHFGKF